MHQNFCCGTANNTQLIGDVLDGCTDLQQLIVLRKALLQLCIQGGSVQITKKEYNSYLFTIWSHFLALETTLVAPVQALCFFVVKNIFHVSTHYCFYVQFSLFCIVSSV